MQEKFPTFLKMTEGAVNQIFDKWLDKHGIEKSLLVGKVGSYHDVIKVKYLI